MHPSATRFFYICLAIFIGIAGADNVQININSEKDLQAATDFPRSLGGALYSTRFEDVVWDNNDWTLTTTVIRPWDFHSAAYTANGYIGLSMASNGPFVQQFLESSGWPLFDQRQTFGTISGFFDRQAQTNGTNFPWLSQYGSDSAISGIPAWGPLIIDLGNGKYLDANTSISEMSNVTLIQDYRNGFAKWDYTWTPSNAGGVSFNISYTAFAHKLHLNRGYVCLELQSSQDTNLSIVNVLDGFDALRTNAVETGTEDKFIYTSVSPIGVSEVAAWIYAGLESSEDTSLATLHNISGKPYIGHSDSSIAQAISVSLKAGQISTTIKYAGVASTDAFQNPKSQAKEAVTAAMEDGYSKSLQSHSQEWSTVMPRTSVSDYTDPLTGTLPKSSALIEKTLVDVVSIFNLLMNTVSQNALSQVNGVPVNVNGISVCGLTTDCYAGQRFWDQDVWMQPFLAATFPFAAKQIANSRVQQYPQAKANVKTAYQSSKNGTKFSDEAAIYPWTSGRDANCTATGPCFDYEYHLNGDIAHSFTTLWASSGDTSYFKDNLFNPMQSIATVFSNMLEKNGSYYELTNTTDPDEYANHVDNGGFTMPLIASTMNDANWFREFFGQLRDTDWDEQMSNLISADVGDISLEYSGMNGSIEVKQADVVLKIYPLNGEENYTLASQLADLNYYAGKQSQNGPGMTYAIFSIDANDVTPSGCPAYTYDLNSWSPYVREPWFSFSEQLIDDYSLNGGTNPAFPFLTGHGGFLQVDLFGYLGLRYSANFTLRINPSLPPQIPHLSFPTFYWHGWPIKAVSNQTSTTLTRLPEALDSANTTFATSPIQIVVGKPSANFSLFSLPPNGTITVPNGANNQNKTVPLNILQCLTATSPQSYQPGQFPLAAIDGAISTLWQPTNATTQSSITVDTSSVPFQPLSSLQFDWADMPPLNASVVLHNQSCPDTAPGRITIALTNVTVSRPYDEAQAAEVKPYESNTTVVDLQGEGVWSANWATLTVWGNHNGTVGGVGAKVAEWALVGSGG